MCFSLLNRTMVLYDLCMLRFCNFRALESDLDSVTDDDDFKPFETPGGKLDESRYEAYHRSLKQMRGITHPSQYKCMRLS